MVKRAKNYSTQPFILLSTPSMATIMPRCGDNPQSLSDAELPKDAIEDVDSADGADNFA